MENPADRAAGATGTLMSARGHEKLLRNLRCQRMSTSPSSDCRRDDHGCRFVPNTPIMRPILGRRELVEIDPDHELPSALSLSRPRPARRTRSKGRAPSEPRSGGRPSRCAADLAYTTLRPRAAGSDRAPSLRGGTGASASPRPRLAPVERRGLRLCSFSAAMPKGETGLSIVSARVSAGAHG